MWSRAVDGVRGRLLLGTLPSAASLPARPELEVENVGRSPRALQAGNPFAFQCVLRAGAVRIEPTLQRGDVLSTPRWIVVQPGQRQRIALTIDPVDGASGAQLDVTTASWRLAPGRYDLGGRYVSGAFTTPAPANAWNGTLDLPEVVLVTH